MRKFWIVGVFSFLLGVVFILLGVRVFWLQKYKADSYRNNSRLQLHTTIIDPPQRGLIIDRKSMVVAASNKVNEVFAEPRALADIDTAKRVSMILQGILDMPGHEICKAIFESGNPGYVMIKSGITPGQRGKIIKAKNDGELKGIGLQTGWVRHYPMGQLMGHLVGFIDSESVGQAGVEKKYDVVLKGSEGRNVLVVDGSRKPIGSMGELTKVRDGSGLILTIDSTIQQFVREELLAQYKAYEAESAVAMVMDPWSGAILAMVSVPDYDPENIQPTDMKTTVGNKCLTDPYEPGSIFKPIVAAVALDNGSLGYNEKIYCEKGHYYGKGFGKIGEWGNHRFESITIREILAESSNIGMAKIGQKMGKKKLYKGVKQFGFGEKTGIDLPGEEPGVVRDLRKWDGYSITRVPFGHEVSVTAVQIARAYCVIANGGMMVKPHIVKGVVGADGNVQQVSGLTSPAGFIVKPEVANWIVREALTAVVNEGTGDKAALDDWQVFGKTGTANIASGSYDETNYVASFAGGAPAEKPEVIVLVSIRKPNKSLGNGYSGGRVAAPVAGKILEKTLTYLGTPPDKKEEPSKKSV